MEFWLLAKIGMVVKAFVTGGYAVASGYVIKTGLRYVDDYKESVANEKEVK
ncbi:hypothetical protein PQE66_gp237 [Bacillus phage PBC2]|uniref:Uncharacterized protein n=1 Tax=Bacillus phage PBC2 TaxID=1675029 RepID=A0A218KCD2_9CAUD|nr:hypothetical protein PQE66_gp237 [Bacillus phage PBC2]AKQ08559.1 hypothetical protein PBC2_244 [Bacillus phage PBC2]UUV45902.1 hypothetical protein [Bacillus phage vB_BanS-Thrax1]UUV46405.1 hypothetical protein [Bacillus phage vB_BanS-Thrax3]